MKSTKATKTAIPPAYIGLSGGSVSNKLDMVKISCMYIMYLEIYRVPPPPKKKQNKNGTVDSLGLCSDQQLFFFTLAG